ncbi:hypothetical protein, partial [Corynebacterium sp.]|uniref:hypothetical protein n=1 Tax=Corynebacterium sp. TaxID=1720 RepID=UPI0026E10310
MDLETLQELLRTGRDTPVTLTLRHEVPDGSFEITGGYTWSMTPAVWFFDPDGVRVHRHAGGYAVDRGTEPVARRAGRAVWLFHTTPPTYYDTAQVLTRPEVLPFLEPRLDAAVPAA